MHTFRLWVQFHHGFLALFAQKRQYYHWFFDDGCPLDPLPPACAPALLNSSQQLSANQLNQPSQDTFIGTLASRFGSQLRLKVLKGSAAKAVAYNKSARPKGRRRVEFRLKKSAKSEEPRRPPLLPTATVPDHTRSPSDL